jgi:hypothetical protein
VPRQSPALKRVPHRCPVCLASDPKVTEYPEITWYSCPRCGHQWCGTYKTPVRIDTHRWQPYSDPPPRDPGTSSKRIDSSHGGPIPYSRRSFIAAETPAARRRRASPALPTRGSRPVQKFDPRVMRPRGNKTSAGRRAARGIQ